MKILPLSLHQDRCRVGSFNHSLRHAQVAVGTQQAIVGVGFLDFDIGVVGSLKMSVHNDGDRPSRNVELEVASPSG